MTNVKDKRSAALILSGSGHLDGAEITESVSLLIALSEAGYHVDFYAPNRPQREHVNHQTGAVEEPNRNILTEAARIARGTIAPLEKLNVDQYETIALPGGFGVVKNLTTFLDSDQPKLKEDIAQVLYSAIDHKCPIIAICAAPLTIALLAREKNLQGASFTFGQEENADSFLSVINQWNIISHHNTEIDEAHIDYKNRTITSGAYMFGDVAPHKILSGARAAVSALEELDE